MDSDHDGMPDDAELQNGTNPNNPFDADADPDGDGLTNGDEVALGTNPNSTDSDGDGIDDGTEVQLGYDPKDPASFPPDNGPTVVAIEVTPRSVGLSRSAILPPDPVQITVAGTLSTGEIVDLTNNPATSFQALNPAVATVDSFGKIVAVSPGSTTIRVRNANLSSDILVAVSQATSEIEKVLRLPGFANNVDVKDRFAYVACGLAGLQVVDARDPATAHIVGSVELPGNANDVRVAGNFAYVACGEGGLQVVDISTPSNPILAGGAQFGRAVDVVVKGNFAFVAAGENGLKVFDLSFAPYISEVGSFPLTDPTTQFANGVDVDETRQLAYLAVANGGMYILDVATPANPQLRSIADVGSLNLDVAALGTTAQVIGYSALTTAGPIASIDTQTPEAPTFGGVTDFFQGRSSDAEVRNDLIFTAINGGLATGFIPVFRQLPGQVKPIYLGAYNVRTLIGVTLFPYATGIAVDNSRIYLTAAARTIVGQNERTGDTILQIVKYGENDTSDIAPVVEITNPVTSGTVVGGELLPIRVTATDDVAVVGVEVKINGVVAGNLTESPYELEYPFPVGGQSLEITARAIDAAGNVGEAVPVTVTIEADPLTSVVGQVVDAGGNPISNVSVTLDGESISGITEGDGRFSLPNISTVPFERTVSVTAVDSLLNRRGRSAAVMTVRGGVTDVGMIRLAGVRSTLLPSGLSALGVSTLNQDGHSDVFVGFSDQPSEIRLSDGNGEFLPDPAFALPFETVTAGIVGPNLFNNLLVQLPGQSGQGTVVQLDPASGVTGTTTFATGLIGECEQMARGLDFPGFAETQKQVLAFLHTTGGTQLTIRVETTGGSFGDPIQVPIAVGIPLRSLNLLDVTQDYLADLVAVADISELDTRLIVIPRTSPTTFGSPIETPLAVRTAVPTLGTEDVVVANFGGSQGLDVAVMGDDRVRVYANDGTGRYQIQREIPLPEGMTPLCLGRSETRGIEILTVFLQPANSPTERVVWFGDGGLFRFESPAGNDESRLRIGSFAG
ncbi:MAG: hypothetical protein HY774_03125, partial [Acidobacteria bacterium]|nr:hypothetical protein [Acidobacteriota bacterium]